MAKQEKDTGVELAQPAASVEDARSGLAGDAIRAGVDAENVPDQPAVGSLKRADQESGPFIADARTDDDPVRADRPDVPVLQTLKVGAGAHTPPDPERFDRDGRPVEPAAAVADSSAGESAPDPAPPGPGDNR